MEAGTVAGQQPECLLDRDGDDVMRLHRHKLLYFHRVRFMVFPQLLSYNPVPADCIGSVLGMIMRNVEDLQVERRFPASYEAIWTWCNRTGPEDARKQKKRPRRRGVLRDPL